MLIEVLGKKSDKMFDKFCDLLKVENSDLYDLLTAGPSGKTLVTNGINWKNNTESLPNECAVMPIFAFTFNTPNRHLSTPLTWRASQLVHSWNQWKKSKKSKNLHFKKVTDDSDLATSAVSLDETVNTQIDFQAATLALIYWFLSRDVSMRSNNFNGECMSLA